MKTKKIIIRALILFFVALLIEHLTYEYIGIPQLDKLILADFQPRATTANSAFIRGYYSTDCTVGDPPRIYDIALERRSEYLKEKLNVKHLHFADINTSDWSDSTVNNYDIYYEAYGSSNKGTKLYDLYRCALSETLYYPKDSTRKYNEYRVSQYRWIFFYWSKLD